MTLTTEIHVCPVCGYKWVHGLNGGHECSTYLKKRIALLEIALCIYFREEVTEPEFETDQEVIDFILEYGQYE